MITMRYPGGLAKALTLSYDDGVEQDRRLLGILDSHGLKATFNINSGEFPPEGHVWPAGQIHRRMTRSEAQALYGGTDHEIAVHFLTHPVPPDMPDASLVYEIVEDRRRLEEMFGRIVRGMAWPYGVFDDRSVAAARACGILYARGVHSSHDFDLPQDWLRLAPTCHHDDPRLGELLDRFLSGSFINAKLFYLWGHAYEFEAHDNWDVIERFADAAAGRADVWYATNLDICAYVLAWRQLWASADASTVYNPTATPLWAETRGGVIRIGPGETVRVKG